MASTLSQATRDAITTAVTAALAAQATPARKPRDVEASAHFRARDIACTLKPACGKTFRTAKGLAWHEANIKHGKA